MDEHRLGNPNDIKTVSFDPPFSSFGHVDSYGGNSAIRRIFSLARSYSEDSAHTLMTEIIDPTGIILDENDEIKNYFPDYEMKGLHRISFWQSSFKAPDVNVLREEDCIGYAILKHDTCKSKNYDRWHVFEAVFKKYPHPHNCVPNPMKYRVALAGKIINIQGLLYAQQNELNKTCAQVALRSVISRILQNDISYRQINDFALTGSTQVFYPCDGLSTSRIRAVLSGFGIGFRDFDYTQYGNRERKAHPYQKYIYSGVESGAGALVGFRLARRSERHMIPFYGHTFNKDTWAPDADIAYFRVGKGLGYFPSEYWTSSFLGHDDNFGPNFCVPRLYIPPNRVEYVVELLKPGILFDGIQAEALSLIFLYSVLSEIPALVNPSNNIWLKRLADHADPRIQRIVLRAIAIDRDNYIYRLSHDEDWNGNSEDQRVIDVLNKYLPKELWVVEVSIPQLFPANERKLGDIVLNGGLKISASSRNSHFLFVRLPGHYLFEYSKGGKHQDFLEVPSKLTSHLPVIKL